MLSKLIKNPSGSLSIQMFRYVVSGGTAFIFDFGLLYSLTQWAGVHYMVSQVIGYTTGLIITYIMSIYWVFDARTKKNQLHEFGIFTLIGVVGLALTSLFMWLLTDQLGVYYLISKVGTTIIVTGWNFTAKKLILFRKADN